MKIGPRATFGNFEHLCQYIKFFFLKIREREKEGYKQEKMSKKREIKRKERKREK